MEFSNVVIIQGEDYADDTVVPRLRALGADLDRVFVLRGNFQDKHGQFGLSGHIKILKRALAVNRPHLLAIDPIMAGPRSISRNPRKVSNI